MTETFNFLSNIGHRSLSIWDAEKGQFAAYYFDGFNRVGEKVFADTRKAALEKLWARNK